MKKRLFAAIVVNLLLPGGGLIVARREWLGFVLAMLFTICAQLTVFGLLIAPHSVPAPVTALAAGGAVAIWIGGQALLRKCVRVFADPTRTEQIATCLTLADRAMEQGRHENAYGALKVALTVDDEHLETHVKLARLTTRLGKLEEARRAWRIVEQLDRQQSFRREMVQALQRLPYRAEK